MSTFCVLPWYSQESYGNSKEKTPCCLLPNNADIAQIKSDLLQGKPSDSCQKCWNLERLGQKSRRQQENEFLDYKLDRDISLIRQDCIDEKNSIILHQITVSNLCNQACVSCSSGASTRWAEIEKRMDLVPYKYFSSEIHEHGIDFAEAQRISIMGGEPLFDQKTFEILQALLDHGNTDCFVSIVTNGSITLNPEQRKLLEKFSDLNICISIDGIGKRFEYLRWPGKWNVLISNLNQYRELAHDLSVSYTISALNIIYYQETVDWFQKNNLKFNHNIVSHPLWLNLQNMPCEIFQKVPQIDFFKNIRNTEPYVLSRFVENIKNQDKAKNINIENYMPEMVDIFRNSGAWPT